MYVRQLVGRQAGSIVEMPYADAQANLASGSAKAVTESEIAEAGLPPEGGLMEVPPEQLLAGYRIEPSEGGGFDLFDPGGVPLNQAPLHNHAAARSAALDHARATRHLAPLADPNPINIPDDWRTGSAVAKRALAKAIAGEEPKSMAAAEQTIEAELAKRAAGSAATEPVEIPDDWRDTHHNTKRALARAITGVEPESTEAAEASIEAELAKRKG